MDPIGDKAWAIYCANLPEDAGFYAREAEESALAAVYLAGVNAGREEMTVLG